MNLSEAQELEAKHLLSLYVPIRFPIVIARGLGTRLWDTEGREYLDLISGGRAVMGLGHSHPRVVAAVREQAGTLIHVSNDFYTEPQLALARRLSGLTGGMRAFLCNSGAEANEAALKLARKHAKAVAGDKIEIITAYHSFHGRTYGALAATGQQKYHAGFGPLVPGFRYIPFNDREALEKSFGPQTCAVMLEPVLGESGVFPADAEFLRLARQLCDRHQALLLLDEVQTGLGRTGRMFAYQHYGIEPDVITLAKSLGGGVPIGAMLAREPAASTFVPGDHASSFGGSALPAAAALAALDAIEQEGLVENARTVGAYFLERLQALGREQPVIREVRGLGMMLAVDLNKPLAGAIKLACLARGVLINTVGDSMLRLVPALILTREEVDQGVSAIAAALAEVGA